MKNRIVGHRGAGVLTPENTIEALQAAKDLGLSYVEYDIRLTKDDVAVVSHDDSLIRCAHVDRKISESTYDEIKDIDVGAHYALKNMSGRVPTFQEYLDETKRLGLTGQIEFKPNPDDHEKLVDIMTEMSEKHYADTPDDELPLFTSFSTKCLALFNQKKSRPFKTGILIKPEDTSKWAQLADESGADYMHIHALYLTDKIANDVINAGKEINAFHLNHVETAKLAIKRGCQRFTCDVPESFIGVKV